MHIRTWLRYLIGDRQAILEIAAAPQALYVGALFVLSAGFAREYDAEDLLHEPWHLLLPFAASLITSLVLFLPCYGLAHLKRGRSSVPPIWPAYRAFLGLFWLILLCALSQVLARVSRSVFSQRGRAATKKE